MANNIRVDLGSRSYDIIIEKNSLADCASHLSDLKIGRKGMIITNEVVEKWYLEPVLDSFRKEGFCVDSFILPDGEQTKSIHWLEQIYHKMMDIGLDRHSFLVALGGGVVGDLTGFAASTFMRGIDFIQIPTTLLSQVDSSVGGKTGINLREGKNLVGAFYQPRLVVIDPQVLTTLDERQLRAGFAEVIKYGVIRDDSFFDYLEKNIEGIFNLDDRCIEKVVSRSCEIKSEVVEKDERESGLRAILNFGHTAGHAFEAITGYSKFVHGEAVAIGMMVASSLGEKVFSLDKLFSERLKSLIKMSGLPYSIPLDISDDKIVEFMKRDKKVKDDKITFVLPRSLGSVEIVKDVSVDDILWSINRNR